MLLRALQLGLTLQDLDYIEYGELVDMTIERSNDNQDYPQLATQEDFDRF